MPLAVLAHSIHRTNSPDIGFLLAPVPLFRVVDANNPYEEDLGQFGYSVSVICKCHYVPSDRVNIELSRRATVPVKAGSVMVPDAVAEAFRIVVPDEEPARISVPELNVLAPVFV